jgi:hypothetical protein
MAFVLFYILFCGVQLFLHHPLHSVVVGAAPGTLLCRTNSVCRMSHICLHFQFVVYELLFRRKRVRDEGIEPFAQSRLPVDNGQVIYSHPEGASPLKFSCAFRF